MAIDGARTSPLAVVPSSNSDSVTIDLGQRRFFVAWLTVNMIDPLGTFDRDNAIAADIFTVDGSFTPVAWSGGDHFGPLSPPGQTPNGVNVFRAAHAGFGRRINLWLRMFGPDLAVGGEAIVVF